MIPHSESRADSAEKRRLSMGLFGKSFEESVQEAIETILGMGLGLRRLDADINGKIVTLQGVASSKDVKLRVMREFNELVETENTINMIKVEEAVKAAAPVEAEAAPAGDRTHEVKRGDTLSKIAKKYYGKAGLYPKIFEANRDILDDPNLIKVGQKLRIPD
jgi:LysM repeat protein